MSVSFRPSDVYVARCLRAFSSYAAGKAHERVCPICRGEEPEPGYLRCEKHRVDYPEDEACPECEEEGCYGAGEE